MEYWKIGEQGEEIAKRILIDNGFVVIPLPRREELSEQENSPWVQWIWTSMVLVASFDFHCVRKGKHWAIDVKASKQIKDDHRTRDFKITLQQFLKAYSLSRADYNVGVLLVDLRNNIFKFVDLQPIVSRVVAGRFPDKKVDLRYEDRDIVFKGKL